MKLHLIIKSLREDKALTQEKWRKMRTYKSYISRLEKAPTPMIPHLLEPSKNRQRIECALEFILSKAGITQDDYIKSASTPTFLRAKYNLNEQQIHTIESFIEHVKKELKIKPPT